MSMISKVVLVSFVIGMALAIQGRVQSARAGAAGRRQGRDPRD